MLYFAYGSNLNIEQMKMRCPGAVTICQADIHGYSLEFKNHHKRSWGYLTIDKTDCAVVPGGLWSITDSDLEALDRYEGYPSLYRREIIEVDSEGFKTKAITYIMNNGVFCIPTKQYWLTCMDGYKDFDIDKKHLLAAAKRAQYGGMRK